MLIAPEPTDSGQAVTLRACRVLRIPGQQATITRAGADAAAEDGVRLLRSDRDVAGLAATWLDIIFPGDRALEADARQHHRPVVLL